MTILTRLEQWKEQGTISPEQHAHLVGLLDERRVHRTRPAIAPLNNARPASKQPGCSLRWGAIGGRRRQQRFLKSARWMGHR
jgi:hypothetical protein